MNLRPPEEATGKPSESPEWFQSAILDSLTEGILIVGADERILYLNQVAQKLLGYSPKEIQGQPCIQMLSCESCQSGCLLSQAAKTGRKRMDFDTGLRKRDGKLISLSGYITLVPEQAGDAQSAALVFQGISQTRTFSDSLSIPYKVNHIIGSNPRVLKIYEQLPDISKTKSTVLIEGESGTGKELLAQSIHQLSPRNDRSFIRVNCGALAEGILESELFGHIKGAFTGAIANKIGRFELADEGTIFLDEIGDLSPSTQVKLLRVLQEEEFERVGESRRMKVDVRVIAATHKDLSRSVQSGEFRQDLYYRLKVMPITLPPLRERKEDILPLIEHFLKKFNREFGRDVQDLSTPVMEILQNYHFPGNIRELENVIEHAMVLCTVSTIQVEHLPMDILDFQSRAAPETRPSARAAHLDDPLKASEREVILKILDQTGWNYQETSRRLNKSRVTLWRKMRELGIQAPRKRKKVEQPDW